MAKQSGIHQLRGKVGEHSYYRQTGIQSGLVRSINQGMSSRVKTEEAFVNTRLNNAEFGQAGRLASIIAKYIVPKFRPMVLPFSQSKMAKVILELIKQDSTAPWGQRNIVQANSGDMHVLALNSVVKKRFADFGLNLDLTVGNNELDVIVTDETINKLSSIAADGIDFRFVAIKTWIGKYNTIRREYVLSVPKSEYTTRELDNPSVDDNFQISYSLPGEPPLPNLAFASQPVGLLILLPYRTVNGRKHILQEECTYKAFNLVNGTAE